MTFHIVTLFPEYFKSALEQGILARAIKNQLIEISFTNPRDFSENSSRRVDEAPFGGGDGMVLSYHPLRKSLESISKKGHVIYLSSQGELWSARRARELSKKPCLTLICGRYGGVDERFIQDHVQEEVSIGDYILNGGEVASLAVLESISRFVPDVLGNESSVENESFENLGLLEGPLWTRPKDIEGHEIPKVMLGGNHKKIKEFRFHVSLVLTAIKRPHIILNNPSLISMLPQAQKELKGLSLEELSSLRIDMEKLNLDHFIKR